MQVELYKITGRHHHHKILQSKKQTSKRSKNKMLLHLVIAQIVYFPRIICLYKVNVLLSKSALRNEQCTYTEYYSCNTGKQPQDYLIYF